MYVLNKQQAGNTAGDQQRESPIAPAGKAEIQQKHGGGMPREEEILCDKPVVSIKEIT